MGGWQFIRIGDHIINMNRMAYVTPDPEQQRVWIVFGAEEIILECD